MNPRLLSSEELARIKQDYPPSTIQGDLHALLAHIAALEAEHAKALQRAELAEQAHAVTAASLSVALVRARNEGLDLAATSEEHAAMAWEEMGDADEAKRCRARASNIRAMMETEQ